MTLFSCKNRLQMKKKSFNVFHFTIIPIELHLQVQLVTLINDRNIKKNNVVPNPLVVVYNFLVIQIQVVPLIVTHLVVLWWLCVNHILNLICNLDPLLHNTSSIQALGSMISLCVAYFACLHMVNANISLCS